MLTITHLYDIYPKLLVKLHYSRLQLVYTIQFQWRLTIQGYFKQLRDILLLLANTSSHAVNMPTAVVSAARTSSVTTEYRHTDVDV
jgi:hypothetical protein